MLAGRRSRDHARIAQGEAAGRRAIQLRGGLPRAAHGGRQARRRRRGGAGRFLARGRARPFAVLLRRAVPRRAHHAAARRRGLRGRVRRRVRGHGRRKPGVLAGRDELHRADQGLGIPRDRVFGRRDRLRIRQRAPADLAVLAHRAGARQTKHAPPVFPGGASFANLCHAKCTFACSGFRTQSTRNRATQLRPTAVTPC